MKRFLKTVGGILLFVLILAALVCVTSQFAPDKPPSDFVITHNFVDLSQISFISKFRSCDGHETIPAWSDEPHSNMQHYFYTVKGVTDSSVKIFAPFDGYVYDAGRDGISMVPLSSKFPWWWMNQWRLSILHSKVLPQYEGFAHKVTAGTLLGYGVKEDESKSFISMDVRVDILSLPPQCMDGNCEPYKKMDSIFNYMSDAVFAEYQKAFPALQNRTDAIISKSDRLAASCQFQGNGPFFNTPQSQFITEHFFNGVATNDTNSATQKMNDIFSQ